MTSLSGYILTTPIRPTQILIHPDTGEVKLTGLGLATRLSRHRERRAYRALESQTPGGLGPERAGHQRGDPRRGTDHRPAAARAPVGPAEAQQRFSLVFQTGGRRQVA